MTIQTAFTHIIGALEPLQGQREAANIAHILMEYITGLSKMDRIVYKDQILTPEQQTSLDTAVKAMLAHQPVQYVTGVSWFYGMELKVNANVLIPRPETEELVEWIVQDIRTAKHLDATILDIGTGSGAIPLAIKRELPHATVYALDVSEGALQTAKENAVKQHLDIHFEQVDILQQQAWIHLPMFDIIVSNPPYICQRESADMQEQVVAYEPSLALFVPDEDALLFYREIAVMAKEKLRIGGALYFEINEAFGKETTALLETLGYIGVEIKKDLFGKDRMVKCLRT
ncbi:peptide chain release factor N(5)-glutamine methyltransferase [Chitinophaga rhizophila]|uniref:Release factor glutamine methyltransferase n=1 Tax=Chitinophaga rhizophila TaxID=2866212 RepID=A0ABS7G8J8_9BACT|nr:peptide chain release factor N(5)-glutamine methyltransferase [Chitinophaga rhizophila]MBW8683781.1 peptide chain release factor N(5)-glutamine methyltransferase [Chitinophaga rhizophila]